jgi:outer membrane protein OmpA-like peptidoglycan-associated protein
MKLPKILIGVGGLSVAVLALWPDPAPPEDAASVHEGRTSVALASTPLVLRDGQLAIADVVRMAFEPQSTVLPEDAQAPLQELLDRIADGCILSAQVVGAASEFETAPRPAIDAHLLALQRADAIAALVRNSGVPARVVSSLWTVDTGQRVPDSILWVFSSSSKSACVQPNVAI